LTLTDVGVIETKDMPNRFEKYGEIILDIFVSVKFSPHFQVVTSMR